MQSAQSTRSFLSFSPFLGLCPFLPSRPTSLLVFYSSARFPASSTAPFFFFTLDCLLLVSALRTTAADRSARPGRRRLSFEAIAGALGGWDQYRWATAYANNKSSPETTDKRRAREGGALLRRQRRSRTVDGRKREKWGVWGGGNNKDMRMEVGVRSTVAQLKVYLQPG